MAKSISRYLADISSTSGVLDGTLSTAAQTNITSLGTLSSLTVSGSAAMTLTTAAQPNITSVGTLSTLAMGGNITRTGDLTLDVSGEINLDADGGKIRFKDGGTEHFRFVMDNAGFVQIYSAVQDADIKIQGNDGGSVIDALTFDMSEGGKATFLSDVTAGGKFIASTTSTTDSVLRLTDGGVADYDFTFPDTGTIQLGTSTSSNKELKLLNAGSGMFGLNVEGHILPAVNNTYSLGSSSLRYYQVWAGTNMVSPTYIATGNVTTGGYQLTNTNGDGKPAITSDANNWTIIRPIISGGDVAINNFANTANLFTITDEGHVGLNENTPTSYYTKTFQINGSGTSSAIKLTNTATGNANNRGHDIASDSADMRLANREANGHWQVYTTAVTDSPQLAIDVTEDQEVSMPKQPSFLARASANNGLNATSTAYTVRYGGHSVLHNIGSHFDASDYKFTAPITGSYFFSANLRVDGFSGGYSYLTLKHYSSTDVLQSDKGRDLQDGNNSTYLNHIVTAVVYLAVGDYVYLNYIANGDSSVNLSDDSWFSGYLLG